MGLGFWGSLIIGGLAGWFASMIMKTDTGLILNIILGIVGAAFLNFVASLVGLTAEDGWFGQLLVGTAGACALIAIYRAVTNKSA